ncbi:MAG: hypothetical protein DMG12_23115 [Acidobacteria bacterium]|nr:MAG: hypothetical protein DMG12_23115 [Acidobacteriota bacterium]
MIDHHSSFEIPIVPKIVEESTKCASCAFKRCSMESIEMTRSKTAASEERFQDLRPLRSEAERLLFVEKRLDTIGLAGVY